MFKSDGRLLTAWLVMVVLVWGAAPFLKGGLYLAQHEGDVLHLAELALRMADGEWPHLDFMTPLGLLSVWPIALFVQMGFGLGHAFALAQVAVALILLPATVFVVSDRLTPHIGRWPARLYGAYVLILCLAYTHGEARPIMSISMHYNRWAWAIAFLVLPLVMIPRTHPRVRTEGLVIGLAMAALVLTKLTYFVALAPVVLVALVVRRWWATLAWAALAGLSAVALIAATIGPDFWLAYARDALTVARSDIRPQPGETLAVVLSSPLYLGAHLALLGAIIFLRQSQRLTEGALMLLAAPGLIYITYQNFGNDPQWLPLVATLLFALRPPEGVRNDRGWDMRRACGLTALVALVLGFSSVMNVASSPMRLLGASEENHVPLLPRLAQHDDIFSEKSRMYGVWTSQSADGPGDAFERFHASGKHEFAVTLNGETLPECELRTGLLAGFELLADDLQAAGYGGRSIYVADLFNQLWLFGPFERLRGGAAWYYGGTPGIEEAEFVLVPLCSNAPEARKTAIEALEAAGVILDEAHRGPNYILFSIGRTNS